MSTNEERITRMHDRAKEMKIQRTKMLFRIESAVTGVLGVCVVALVCMIGFTPVGGATAADTGFAGAAMLSVTSGSFLLVYVAAFFFGLALMLSIRTYRNKQRQENEVV